jgi:2-polyprenyl-3-methyl-5-hydroxy-6-metoxy-1,4-benzoquinol methylase
MLLQTFYPRKLNYPNERKAANKNYTRYYGPFNRWAEMMQLNDQNEDKAGKAYWNKAERNMNVEFRAFTPQSGVRGFGRRMKCNVFEKIFRGVVGSDKKLLELGCGGSAYLPYFARRFGFTVYGIDYSERGCDLAREMCDANAVTAQIFCTDFFEAPSELLGQFDVVVSFGVVEHFTDTATTLSRFAEFLRPGGLMLTIVPNMSGLCGACQKFFSRDIFAIHEVIDTERFRKSHEDAGLTIIENEYFMFTNFGVINPGNNPSLLKRLIFLALKGTTGLVWAMESVLGPMPPNRFSSPYVMCVARSSEDIANCF